MAVSIRDVAVRAGVSVGTVSNVLNGSPKVSVASTDRVRQAIDDLGYVRNDAARQLRAGRSRTVGFVVLDVRNPFFTDVAAGAETAAAEAGLTLLIGGSDGDARREASYLQLFEEQRVHGVLLSPLDGGDEALVALRARGTPAVLVDRASGAGLVSSVSVDDVLGGRLAAEHLLDTGRRRIAVLGDPRTQQSADRIAGARAALAASGADAQLEVILRDGLGTEEGRDVALEIAGRPASERPDALFTVNDLLAIGALQGFHATGIDVPGEIALLGFDDIDFAAAAAVPLSSIRQPRAEMGATALRILLDEAADPERMPRHVVLKPELVVRASSAPR